MTAADDRRVSTRATGVVGIAILSSRVLGLIREMVFAGLFGAGKYLDAFLMAFRLPNLLRDLFAEARFQRRSSRRFRKRSQSTAINRRGAWRTRSRRLRPF